MGCTSSHHESSFKCKHGNEPHSICINGPCSEGVLLCLEKCLPSHRDSQHYISIWDSSLRLYDIQILESQGGPSLEVLQKEYIENKEAWKKGQISKKVFLANLARHLRWIIALTKDAENRYTETHRHLSDDHNIFYHLLYNGLPNNPENTGLNQVQYNNSNPWRDYTYTNNCKIYTNNSNSTSTHNNLWTYTNDTTSTQANKIQNKPTTITMRDGHGNYAGRIENNGIIRDSHGNKTGSIERNGTFRNAHGNKIGAIENNGTVRNAHGMKMGTINKDGIVRDSHGNRIGSVDKNGTIRNAHGVKIGQSSSNDPKAIADKFFFNKK